MTSPCPILARYKLVESRPYVCLYFMYVQNLPAAHASVVVGLHSLPPVLDHFLVSLSFMACPIWGWALLDGGLYFFLSPPFFLLLSPAISLYHSCCRVCFVSVCRPFLTIFWFPFPLWLAPLGAGPCLTMGFAFL